MNVMTLEHRNPQVESSPRVTRGRAIEWAQALGAVAGLIGGGASRMFRSAFTVASWFVADESARRWLSTTGGVLLFLVIPLLIIGGYCLDWIEKDKPQRGSKVARYENNGEQ
jgi:hypothetical protein